MNALDLLHALRATIPGANIHLRLSDDATQLVVGICDRPGAENPRFFDATLDAADLATPPTQLAAEIAKLRAAHLAAPAS